MRRVSCASTSAMSRSRGLATASSIAARVISWNTMRFTGTRGDSTSSRCQRDRFALAVLVGGEVDLARVLQQRLEFADLLLLRLRDHVQRLEVVVDVDAVTRPLLGLVGLGDLLGAAGQVADVADGGLHEIVVTEEARDGAGLGWGLDDDKGFGHDSFSSVGRRRRGLSNAEFTERDHVACSPMSTLLDARRPARDLRNDRSDPGGFRRIGPADWLLPPRRLAALHRRAARQPGQAQPRE